MKQESHDENDRQLQSLLRDWKIEASLPPRFDERVWRRIASEEKPAMNPLLALKTWLGQFALKPAFALSYATILVLFGLVGGLLQAEAKSHRASEELSTRYVQMVDPYQMPRH
jgi:hypothetical protein